MHTGRFNARRCQLKPRLQGTIAVFEGAESEHNLDLLYVARIGGRLAGTTRVTVSRAEPAFGGAPASGAFPALSAAAAATTTLWTIFVGLLRFFTRGCSLRPPSPAGRQARPSTQPCGRPQDSAKCRRTRISGGAAWPRSSAG